MDAFLSRSGIKNAKTDIKTGEVYLLAEPSCDLSAEEVKRMMEEDYGYGFRSFERSTVKKWEDLGDATR
jgi:uncharacterized protein (DUF1697 family)